MSDGPQREMTRGEMTAAVNAANWERARCASERDSAIARAEKAERERDTAAGSLVISGEMYKAKAAEAARLREALTFIADGNVSPAISYARAALATAAEAPKMEETP